VLYIFVVFQDDLLIEVTWITQSHDFVNKLSLVYLFDPTVSPIWMEANTIHLVSLTYSQAVLFP